MIIKKIVEFCVPEVRIDRTKYEYYLLFDDDNIDITRPDNGTIYQAVEHFSRFTPQDSNFISKMIRFMKEKYPNISSIEIRKKSNSHESFGFRIDF